MALVINNWDDISGKVIEKQNGKEVEYNLYGEDKCNCFLAMVYEYEGDDGKTYEQLQCFFMDERHGKIMLGLQKGINGKKENYLSEVTKLIIYKSKCSNWKKIVTMFADALDTLMVEIREE